MAEKKVIRKLAAILVADMVGYSRLMGADEAGTIARLKAHRKELIDPKFGEHHGRIVKVMGDGLLVEFASADDAVQCAVEIQRAMAEREAEVAQDQRIIYRIGINIGDIVIEGDDILGDGVNVAARMEALAEPGGICISRPVFTQIRNKVELGFVDLGPQKVKNIAEPVPTYKVLLDPAEAGTVVAAKRTVPTRLRWVASAAAAVLLLVLASMAWWQPWVTRVEPARLAKMAFPLPKKPSIAVLPFDNLSGDKTQDYLADGLSENIIQALSKIPRMFVIARNSTFTYKGKPVKVRRVAEELGVRYVLEGSIQKSGDRIRVTAQLIDAITGRHLWSERYDRKLTGSELFAVQDEITRKIVVALQVKLTDGEEARVRNRTTNNLQAWGYVVRARKLFYRLTKADNARARELLGQAVALDPQYVNAWTLLAWIHLQDARFGYSASRAKSLGKAVEIAKMALVLGPDDPDAHALMGSIHLVRRKYDLAVAEGRKALELGPNMSSINAGVAIIMRYVGNWNETIALGERAVRLNPRARWWVFWGLGLAYTFKGEYTRAVATHEAGLRRAESDTVKASFHLTLAFAHIEAGQMEKARQYMAQALKLNPRHSARYLRKITSYKNPAHLKRMLAALRKAGLPEHAPVRKGKLAFPLPKKPSIAVLPFNNLSGDKTQDYLADGLSENIITALSKVSEMFVIARNSTFTYKGKPVKVQRVAEELGVRYVLEGSVQKSGERIRVTAQLIDAVKGHHLWSERYDRKLTELFAVQDEITLKIVTALQVKLTEGEQARARGRSPNNLQAWGYYIRGQRLFRRMGKEDNARAQRLFKRAIKLDGQYAAAWAYLAWTYWADVQFGWSASRPKSFRMAEEALSKAIALDPEYPRAHNIKARLHTYRREYDRALAATRKALELGPNMAYINANSALTMYRLGNWDEAIGLSRRAVRLSPHAHALYFLAPGVAHVFKREYDLAIATLEQGLRRAESDFIRSQFRLYLVFAHIEAGRTEKARRHMAQALKLNPRFSSRYVPKFTLFKNPAHLERMLAALRKAGLPE